MTDISTQITTAHCRMYFRIAGFTCMSKHPLWSSLHGTPRVHDVPNMDITQDVVWYVRVVLGGEEVTVNHGLS